MRDIGNRIGRYRLSRYAAASGLKHRRLRWAIPVVLAWALWAGVLSDHSFVHLWKLERETTSAHAENERVSAEAARLESQIKDPRSVRATAERTLRESGGMAKQGEIIYRIEGRRDSLARD